MSVRRIYLASPLGFSAAGRLWSQEVLRPAVARFGLEALDPWAKPDNPFPAAYAVDDRDERVEALGSANAWAGTKNAELIRSADAVLAILDGPDVDSGTAAEIGYAAAFDIPVVGLRTDYRMTGDNEAARVNLQVEYFITLGGGAIFGDLDAGLGHLQRLLDDRGGSSHVRAHTR